MKSLFIGLFFLFVFSSSHAAYIEKIKGKKALIFLDGLSVEKGTLVYSINPNGKKTSILRITTVKDDKAIGQLQKGKAKINQEIIIRDQAPSEQAAAISGESTETESKPTRSSKKSAFSVGALLGFALDNMEIKINNETIDQTGTGFSFFTALDYKIFEWLSLRGMLGYEKIDVSGDSKDTTTSCRSCDTSISYVGAVFWGKISPIKSPLNFWIGGGFGILHPASKSSNALETSSIDTTGVYAVGGGADININADLYMPIQLEYSFLPSSSDVKTNIYALRAGLMYRF